MPIIDEVLIECGDTLLRAAAIAGGALIDLATEPRRAADAPGSIYKGRVVRRAPGIRGVFVEIGLDRPALLDIGSGDAAPREGEAIDVQVIEAAFGSKGCRVSRRLALEGAYVVLLPGGKGVSVSRRLADPEARDRLQRAGRAIKGPGEGVIVRRSAADAEEPALAAELARLRLQWQHIAAALATTTPPACVHDQGDGLVQLLRRFARARRFVFDDAAVARHAGRAAAGLGLRIAIDTETDGKLFDRHGVGDVIASAGSPAVPLPSGGRIVVDVATALTAIDVDTALGEGAEILLRTNLEAAAEIGRQLWLRDIGGVVVVDFLKTPASSARARIEAALRRSLANDRIAVELLGWTRAGLFEMIRPRARSPRVLE
jgi:ribonuclease G